jgi:hypothetical protein
MHHPLRSPRGKVKVLQCCCCMYALLASHPHAFTTPGKSGDTSSASKELPTLISCSAFQKSVIAPVGASHTEQQQQ